MLGSLLRNCKNSNTQFYDVTSQISINQASDLIMRKIQRSTEMMKSRYCQIIIGTKVTAYQPYQNRYGIHSSIQLFADNGNAQSFDAFETHRQKNDTARVIVCISNQEDVEMQVENLDNADELHI